MPRERWMDLALRISYSYSVYLKNKTKEKNIKLKRKRSIHTLIRAYYRSSAIQWTKACA